MTDFTVTITDMHELAGITAAREDHNANVDPAGDPSLFANQTIATDADYVQGVMENAAKSYAVQYGT